MWKKAKKLWEKPSEFWTVRKAGRWRSLRWVGLRWNSCVRLIYPHPAPALCCKSFCTSSALVRATEMSSTAKSRRGARGSSGWSLSWMPASMSSTIFCSSEWRKCTSGTRAYSKSRWAESQQEAESHTNTDSHSSRPALCVQRRFWNTLEQKPSSLTRSQPQLQAIWLARGTLSASDTAANTSPTFISAERQSRWSPSHPWQALWGILYSSKRFLFLSHSSQNILYILLKHTTEVLAVLA